MADPAPTSPRLQELFGYLDVRRHALKDAIDAVPEPMRNRQPEDGCWSVAEVVEHLALVEARFRKVIADHLAAARVAGLRPESDATSVVASFDQSAILDRSSKHVAPDPVRPQGLDCAAAWTRLEDERRAFLDIYRDADGLAIGDVVYTHPRLGALNLYQWGVWLGGHEARHTEQIREIEARMKAGV